MMALVSRHLRHYWRLNLAVLLVLTLASALLASLPGHAQAIARRELDRRLAAASPDQRCLLITGTIDTFGDELYEDLRERLGPLVRDRLVIRHAVLPADPRPTSQDAGGKPTVGQLDVYSFDRLPEVVRIVEGRLPEQVNLSTSAGYSPPPIEAVIGQNAAEQSGYGIGDRLTASGLYHRLDIVGIVEPLDPHDDIWGGDLSAFRIPNGTEEPGTGVVSLPLMIASQSMRSWLGKPVFPHELSWRITLKLDGLDPNAAAALQTGLINLETQSTTRGAVISSGLLHILAETLAHLSRVRASFLLLTVQTLLFVLYALALFTSSAVGRVQPELATLVARGASVWQVTRLSALQYLILALAAALLLGPALAWGTLYLWSGTAGDPGPGILPGEAWLLSSVAAGLGWLVLMSAVFVSARRYAPTLRPRLGAPPLESLIQGRYLDLYLLAFAGLLYWQLNQKGSFLMRQLGDMQVADPILLMGPTLLLIAGAMVLLRLVPLLFRLVAWPFGRLRSWALPLGLSHLARDPLRAGRMVLLISLTAGLIFFHHIFGASLAHSPEMLPSEVLLQGISSALQLNVLMLLLFGGAIFFLVSLLTVLVRRRELGIMRTLGLSVGQWLATVLLEGIVTLVVGLLAGGLVGWGLAHIMIPYLSQSLLGLQADDIAPRVVVGWEVISRWYALLLVAYGSALAAVWLVAWHSEGQRVEDIGVE